MRLKLKTYLIYSSVFAIFTEAFFFNYIIDWKLLYLIIGVNYLLLLRLKQVKMHRFFYLLILAFFIHGALAYTIIGIPYNFMLSQILGIAVVGTYYYSFVSLYPRRDILNVYLKLSVYVALIGYVLWFIYKDEPLYRLMSIFKEPAHYVIVVIPACYYYFKVKDYKNFMIIFGTLVLSNSSLGYIGCGLMFLIPNLTLRRIGYFTALLPIVAVTFIYMYQELPFFKMRVEDTYKSLDVINTGKFDSETNLSSYVMISNMFVARNNIQDHPLGSGIGSHHYMHVTRYGTKMRPPEYIVRQNKEQFNSFDANSLFVRILSELGILGICLLIIGLKKSSACFLTNVYISQGIFIYFLLKLFRDGHFFPPELFFFIWMFYFSYKDHKIQNDSLTM